MGITGYYDWLTTNYTNIFKRVRRIQKYDHILIDLNFILHNSMRGSRTEKHFILRVCKTLDYLLSKFIGLRSIYIAIDGVAPYSKIAVQRSRRSKVKSEEVSAGVSSIGLTPGTKLMGMVKKHVTNYLRRRSNWSKFRRIRTFISGADEAGEGEVKLFKYINQVIKRFPNDNFLVVGNDADLVVLAMAQATPNIDLLIKRDNIHTLLSVKTLINKHTDKMSRLKSKDGRCSPVDSNRVRNDFAVLSMLMENDYLHKPYYITPEQTWESYFRTIMTRCDYLTTDQQLFNKDFLVDMMLDLSTEMAPQYRSMNFARYAQLDVKNYLEGFLWCLEMYRTGVCPMTDYLCTGGTPSPYQIFYYLMMDQQAKLPTIPRSSTSPIDHRVFTLVVLPRKAIRFIPSNLHQYVNGNLAPLYTDEECEECNRLRGDLSTHHKLLRALQLEDEDTTQVRTQISATSKEFYAHKKANHAKRLTVPEIIDLVQKTVPLDG